MAAAPPGVRRSELGDALRACRGAFIGVFMMSCIINLLYLTGSIFMLEVYDRVLPSRSVPTLVGLVVIAAGLYMAQGFLDLLRGRILGRVGTALDEALNARVFDIVVRLPLVAGGRTEGLQPLRDLDNVRSFLGSMGPGAFFDLPWLPFYLAICFAFHVMIGAHRAGRRRFPGRADADHRIHVASAGARGDDAGRAPQRSCRCKPPQCRGAGRDGDGRPAQQALERSQREVSHRQPERERRHRRPRCGVKGDADDAAILGARRRRLSRDPPGGHGGHHHRGFDPVARARWRRSISRSRTGRASSQRGRAGTASTSCSSRCRSGRRRRCCRIPRAVCRSRASRRRARRPTRDHIRT